MVLIMAKEITVTFEDGGIFEGFANTYTLNNEVTYYFSFDRDYRVQLTNDAIALQEYRNAGAWYPIDIITNVSVSEISGTGGGDVTKDWVNQNFVKKAGDTMTGSLRFNFGNGDMIVIGQSSTTKRGLINFNGNMYFKNEENKIIASFVSTSNLTLNLFQASNGFNSNIYFRNYESGASGLSRSISYTEFRNNDTNTTWEFNGKYQANNTWWFKYGGVYFDTWAYWRSNDIINTIIQNNGGIRIYNGNNLAIHEMAQNAETNYYSAYKYNGRDTFSNVGGQDPRYRITGYNNFASSCEFYSSIRIKNENATSGTNVLLTSTTIYIQDISDPDTKDQTSISKNLFRQTVGDKTRFTISQGRIDSYNSQPWINHSGYPRTTEPYTQYMHNGITTGNYSAGTWNITCNSNIVIKSYSNGQALQFEAPNGYWFMTYKYGHFNASDNAMSVASAATGYNGYSELQVMLDLFRIVYNALDAAGIAGASDLAAFTSDVVTWIYEASGKQNTVHRCHISNFIATITK